VENWGGGPSKSLRRASKYRLANRICDIHATAASILSIESLFA